MGIIALLVGTIPISLTTGFEAQGFAVSEVTGLSEYGEHRMGIPGGNDVVIKGVVLPGFNPTDIRSQIYKSTNPYKQFILQAIHSSGYKYQSIASISSIKCDIHANPCTVTVTVSRHGGWYGGAVVAINEEEEPVLNNDYREGVLYGAFEFISPVNLEIQLTTAFSETELANSILTINLGSSSITVEFGRLLRVIGTFSTGLQMGSVIRIINGLDYYAYLYTAGRVFVLPVLGKVNNGMIPVSTNPSVSLELYHMENEKICDGLPENCSVEVVTQTRETFLTI